MPQATSESTSAWDWWMECLPELVWPAEGLGRWDPRAARALQRGILQGRLKKETRDGRQGPQARLRRLLGEPDGTAALENARRRSPGDEKTRAWLAESLLESNPARALRLLEGIAGPWPAVYRGAALMRLKRWGAAAKAFGAAQAELTGKEAGLAALLAASALLRAGAPAKALDALRLGRAGGCDEAALHWLSAFACERMGLAQDVRLNVEKAMRRFSEIALDPLLGPDLRRESLRGGPCRPPTRRTLALLGSRRRRGAPQAWACVARAETLRSPQFSRYAEAVPLLLRAARLAPRSPWVWAYLGRGLDSVGESQGAKRALDRAAALAPESGWIRAWRGSWLLRHGRASALPELSRAASLSPGYPFARAWRGGALRRAGRLREAARELELAVLLEPGYEWSFAELFQVRRQQGDWEAASSMVTQAYEREMKFTWARRSDPQSCARALEELRGAIGSRPDLPLLRAWRAWILLGLGRIEEARADALAAAASKGPAFAHAVAAEAQERFGDVKRALVHYDRAAALRPCAAYLGARGVALQRLGRLKAALADLRRAVELNGTVARFQCSLGEVLLDLGRPRAAVESLDKALGLDPGFCQALARRADSWRALGRLAAARRDLAQARRLRPDCPWAALAASRLAGNDVSACAELIKAVDRGDELPPRVLAAARRRMGILARRALRRLKEKTCS